MKILKVIIADDHQMIRKAWSILLSEKENVKVIGEAGSGKEVLEILKEQHANLILMDVDMPELDGLETAKIITKNYPWTKVLFLTMHKEKSFAKKIFQAGAYGYLTKNATQNELFKAIDTIAAGEKFISNEIQSVLLEQLDEPEKNEINTPSVSEREKEIIQLISEGLTSKEISEKLFLSIKTVESHRGNIYKKLGVKNVAEMLKLAKSKLLI